ncbi:MAG: sigma-70 factor domain-containing protein [Pirellulales bacterium]
MYDALLEDLDDEESPGVEEAAELVDKDEVVDELSEDDEVAAVDESEAEPDLKADELAMAADDTDSWSDDPVRMYLTQMGEIPLLTRQQEIALAKQIEITRARFRRKLLECDFVIQDAVRILRRVHNGELPFDRTVQVSVTDHLEKEQIMGRFPHNLRTLDVLLKRNRQDYQTAAGKSSSKAERKAAWNRLGRQRRRAVRLVEELGLRTQRIEQKIRALEEFSRRVDELKAKIVAAKTNRVSQDERQKLVSDFRKILVACQETPTSLRKRVHYLKTTYTEYQQAQARSFGR